MVLPVFSRCIRGACIDCNSPRLKARLALRVVFPQALPGEVMARRRQTSFKSVHIKGMRKRHAAIASIRIFTTRRTICQFVRSSHKTHGGVIFMSVTARG